MIHSKPTPSLANSETPYEAAHNEPPNLNLHCFRTQDKREYLVIIGDNFSYGDSA